MREKDLLLKCIDYINSDISSYSDMIDTFKKIGFTDKELYIYKIKDLYTEYYDLKIINENEYWQLCNKVADYIREDFLKQEDKSKGILSAICRKYNMYINDYLYIEGYNSFEELLEDLK